MSHNVSAAYMLRTAFEHELRNYIDIEIMKLTKDVMRDLSEEESDQLKRLHLLRDYFKERIAELGKILP
jgi:hypothetical protein